MADRGAVVARFEVARIRFWLGMGSSIFFLWLAFRNVSLSVVLNVLAETNLSLLVLSLGSVLVTTLAKAARWRFLFYPQQAQVRLSKCFSVLVIGQTVNVLFPARLGEVARAYLIGEIEGVDKIHAFSTVVVEKTLDALMFLGLSAVLLPFVPFPPGFRWSGASLALALLFLILWVGAHQSHRLECLIRSLSRPLTLLFGNEVSRSRWLDLPARLQAVLDSLRLLRQSRAQWHLWGWSAAITAVETSTNYLTLLAVGLALPLTASLFLLIVLRVGAAVPSSPGKVGVFQYLCVLALSAFSVDRTLALSYGIVLHVVVFAPMILLGTAYLWKESLDLQRMVSWSLERPASARGGASDGSAR